MHPYALQCAIDYKKQTLETCKLLLKEGRIQTLVVLLNGLEKNIKGLEKLVKNESK